MKRYAAALAILVLTPMLLAACDSGEGAVGDSDPLSIDGVWFVEAEVGDGRTYPLYLIVRPPMLKTYEGPTSNSSNPCWGIRSHTIIQVDDRTWTNTTSGSHDREMLIYRQGEGLYAMLSNDYYYDDGGVFQRSGDSEPEIASRYPEC